MTRLAGVGLCLLAAGCAASSRAASRGCAIEPGLAGTWTSTRATQLGPGEVTLTLGCDCRYESRVIVLGRTIDERGTFAAAGQALAFGRQSGATTTWPYRLDGGRLMLTEHPTETHAYERVSAETCDAPPARPRLVSFPTGDGGVVYADEYGSGERGLVLAHGGRFTKESWAKQAPVFVEAGFRVLAIDFRGRGQSRGGPQASSADDVHLDVLGAIRYLRESGARTVSVIGASFGGGAAAEAAVHAPAGTLDRLVLLAHAPIDNPEQISAGRTLVILAKDDVSGSGPRLPHLRDQYERVPGEKEFILLEGDAHAQLLFETEHSDRLLRELLRFLK